MPQIIDALADDATLLKADQRPVEIFKAAGAAQRDAWLQPHGGIDFGDQAQVFVFDIENPQARRAGHALHGRIVQCNRTAAGGALQRLH